MTREVHEHIDLIGPYLCCETSEISRLSQLCGLAPYGLRPLQRRRHRIVRPPDIINIYTESIRIIAREERPHILRHGMLMQVR